MDMHKTFYKDKLTNELLEMMDEVQTSYNHKLFLGSQRALQFGGEQLLKSHARLYNCTATHCDRPEVFGELMYMMLCGCGVGFSVQEQHIGKLPDIAARGNKVVKYQVPDSIEGWATALELLISSFFVDGGRYPEYAGKMIDFDYTLIRPKGSLISGGFKAPGPDPLVKAITKIEQLLMTESKHTNRMRDIVAYDSIMHMADAVIAGSVRRAASICLFGKNQTAMMNAKTGNWFIDNPQRARSNNSCLLLRNETTREEFDEIMVAVKDYGEPGFIWVDDLDTLFNPCVEISLVGQNEEGESGFGVCNLCEINGGMSTSAEIFYQQCKVAAIMGTLQAGYTDFKFVTQATIDIVRREALLGVSITGWMNNPDTLFNKEILAKGAEIVRHWNAVTADIIGINHAARLLTVKPSGNASVLLGTASGIHGEHSKRYIRHVQFNKETEIAQLFMKNNPDMCEESVYSDNDIVVGFPVTTGADSIFKSDLLGVKQLQKVVDAQRMWVDLGTNKELCMHTYSKHNVSNTITVDDWDAVAEFIYDNRADLGGVSLLAATGDKAYTQAPFTEVLDSGEIHAKYGTEAMFTSALIETGLSAFNEDLWNALNTAQGFGEVLTAGSADLLKREFVRRFNKFSKNFHTETIDIEQTNEYNALLDGLSYNQDMHKLLVKQHGMLVKQNESDVKIAELNKNIKECHDAITSLSGQISSHVVYAREQKAKEICANCIKDVYNLHKWWKILNNSVPIDWVTDLSEKTFTDIGDLAATACAGGKCEI
jgi:ribonucleoside-diphosphate reductase alpha chain